MCAPVPFVSRGFLLVDKGPQVCRKQLLGCVSQCALHGMRERERQVRCDVQCQYSHVMECSAHKYGI